MKATTYLLIIIIGYLTVQFSSCSPMRTVEKVWIMQDSLKVKISNEPGEVLGFFIVDSKPDYHSSHSRITFIPGKDANNCMLEVDDREYKVVFAYVSDRELPYVMQPIDEDVSITFLSISAKNVPRNILRALESKEYACYGVFGTPGGSYNYMGGGARPVLAPSFPTHILVYIMVACAVPIVLAIGCALFLFSKRKPTNPAKES